ncbi:acetate/propionate family kinase [Candidatus Sumerlaeota bacterium]|nr:acetate/propionate family kinase [Candidatus Sumerlaeota bacterium]
MNILIVKPGIYKLDYAFYAGSLGFPILEGICREKDGRLFREILGDILFKCRQHNNQELPDAIAVYAIHGGSQFTKLEMEGPDTYAKLKELIPSAPLEIPSIMAILESLSELAPRIPRLLLFGSSFFVDLPVRETLYGLNPELIQSRNLRRFGCHGLFHEAASRAVLKKMKGRLYPKNPRIISLSLNPVPEIAAILGRKPMMVTTGLTPLEGLPGHHTCGEIDPAIVLLLAKEKKWGPEKINDILTRQSGLSALADRTATMDHVLESGEEKYKLAREVLLYRILLACGSAVATLGGVDAFVFSGQYAGCGGILAGEILSTSFFSRLNRDHKIAIEFLEDSLDRIIAEKTCAAIRREKTQSILAAC